MNLVFYLARRFFCGHAVSSARLIPLRKNHASIFCRVCARCGASWAEVGNGNNS